MPKAGLTGVIETNPNPQTIKFAGLWVNLSAVARAQGCDCSYISRIFTGKRNPSLRYAQKLAALIGISLDEFVTALDIRVQEMEKERKVLTGQYYTRVAKEDLEDLHILQAGQPLPPRLPALRVED